MCGTRCRLVETVDAGVVDRLVCAWLAARLGEPGGVGLSLDGKTVRHSGSGDGVDVQLLFSAMRHDTAVVVAQVQVPAGTTEVTHIKALLDPIDITGMVITADAAHPRHDTADYLHGRDADYVFTVKANKPALLTAIAIRLPAAITATSSHTNTEHRSGYRNHPHHLDRRRHRYRLPRCRSGSRWRERCRIRKRRNAVSIDGVVADSVMQVRSSPAPRRRTGGNRAMRHW